MSGNNYEDFIFTFPILNNINDDEEANNRSTAVIQIQNNNNTNNQDNVYVTIPEDEEETTPPPLEIPLLPPLHENYFFARSSSGTTSSRSNNFVSTRTIFSNLLDIVDSLLEEEMYQAVLGNSMNTYNEELFRKTDDHVNVDSSGFFLTESEISEIKDVCRICLDDFNTTTKVYKLPCMHYFHVDCLSEAIHHQHHKCPLCRSGLPVSK